MDKTEIFPPCSFGTSCVADHSKQELCMLPKSTVLLGGKVFRDTLSAVEGDEYEFRQNDFEQREETPIPGATGGLGAPVISRPTLTIHETPKTPIEANDTIWIADTTYMGIGDELELTVNNLTQAVRITEIVDTHTVKYEVMTPEKYMKRWTDSWLEGIDYATGTKRNGRRADRRPWQGDAKQRALPRVRGCGHKLDLTRQPRHRNCETCWTAFFRNQDEMAGNIGKIIVEQGAYRVAETFGFKFLTRFHQYCKLVERMETLRMAYEEEQNAGIELATVSDADTVQSVGGDAEVGIEVG